MAITREDLDSFNQFADEKLSNGGAESLTELARQWEQRREQEQSIVALRQSHADAEAGRLHPAAEVFSDVRKKLGQSE